MTLDDIFPSLNSFAIWTYNELYIENKNINFNIAMVNGQEINIKCKKIDFEVIKLA